ncbi:MAG: RodZ domain-containing protein [Burkholderiales bacterium]
MQTDALAPENATPGRILAAARTERGMSISEVAQRLKFSIRHVEALEADRYDALPSGPFARGMIRVYAKLLGVDATRLLEELPRPGTSGEPAMQPRDMSVPFPQDGRPGSRVYLLLSMLIIVAVTVVLAEWFIRSQRASSQDAALPAPTGETVAKVEASPEPVPATAEETGKALNSTTQDAGRSTETTFVPPATASVPSVGTRAGAPTPPVQATAGPSAERAATAMEARQSDSAPASEPLPPGRSRLTFTFEIESWVEVTDASGKIILSGLNSPDTKRTLVGTGPFTLVIGNASGVRLTHDGKPVDLVPHRTSDVARLTLE